MAGGFPAPACSPSCTARPALRRPRPRSPLPRRPLLASGLPAAASHTHMPPAVAAAAAGSKQQAGRWEPEAPVRWPGQDRRPVAAAPPPRLPRKLRPSPRPARHAGKREHSLRPWPRP